MRGYAHEFMEMNINVDPDWGGPDSGSTATSDRGAGPLGFAGTVRQKRLGCNGFGHARRRRIRRRAGDADGAGDLERRLRAARRDKAESTTDAATLDGR